MITLPGRPYIAIPAALRRRCGLRPSDRVPLAAMPGAGTLTAYPLATADQTIAPTARPRMRKEKSHDRHPDFPCCG